MEKYESFKVGLLGKIGTFCKEKQPNWSLSTLREWKSRAILKKQALTGIDFAPSLIRLL